MTTRVATLDEYARVMRLRGAFVASAADLQSGPSEFSSALATTLVELFVELLECGTPRVADEMRRMAATLIALADADGQPAELRRITAAMCDSPNGAREG